METAAPPQPDVKIVSLSFGKTWWGMLLAALLGVVVGVALGARPELRGALGLGRSSASELQDAMAFSRQIAELIQNRPLQSAAEAKRMLDAVEQRRASYASEDARALLTQDALDLAIVADALETFDERRRALRALAGKDGAATLKTNRLAQIWTEDARGEWRRADWAMARIRMRMVPYVYATPASATSAASAAR